MRSGRLALAVVGLTVMIALTTNPVHADGKEAEGRFQNRWFAEDATWNTPIAEDAPTIEGSQAFLQAFLESGTTININREIWTPIVLYADEKVPRCDLKWDRWQLSDFPMHPSLARSVEYFASRKDSDASFCIYSAEKAAFFNLFNARIEKDESGRRVLRVGAGALFPVDAMGWWNNAAGPWSGRSSGASYCGGLVRLEEYGAGRIDHALAMGWPSALVRSARLANAFVFPAKTSDGTGRDPAKSVPMGARLQLDPHLTDAELLKLGVDEDDLPIAHALQHYGSYVVDSSSAMAIYAESAFGRTDAPTLRGAGGLPVAILAHARFVASPTAGRLDSRLSVGQPTLSAAQGQSNRKCAFDVESPK